MGEIRVKLPGPCPIYQALILKAMDILRRNKWELVRLDIQGIQGECDCIDTYAVYMWVVGIPEAITIHADGLIEYPDYLDNIKEVKI